MEKIKYISKIGIIILILSCQINYDQNSKVHIKCSFPSRALTVEDIKLATLRVEGPGIDTQIVETTSNVIEVEVEQGKDREFTLDVKFKDGSHYQGTTVTNVSAGTTTVNILLYEAWLNSITKFVFEANKNSVLEKDYEGVIEGANISVILPQGVEPNSLEPTITHNGNSINKTGLEDFTNTVEYVVTALNGQQATYFVNVDNELVEVKDSIKEITSFKFLASDLNTSSTDISGTISGLNITVNVPFGTNITSLTPSIGYTLTASIDKTTAQNFTTDVKYTVTAEDESTAVYTVKVYIKPEVSLVITSNLDSTIRYSFNSSSLSMLSSEVKTFSVDSATGSIDYATWYVDGIVVLEGVAETSFDVVGSDYSFGSHTITCIVMKGNEMFNLLQTFTIN